MSEAAASAEAETRRAHWERVYAEKGEDALSWFEPRAETSLALIDAAGLALDAVVDIGAGTSRFVDALLARDLAEETAGGASPRPPQRARTWSGRGSNAAAPPASGSTSSTSASRKRPGSSSMAMWAARSKVTKVFPGASMRWKKASAEA